MPVVVSVRTPSKGRKVSLYELKNTGGLGVHATVRLRKSSAFAVRSGVVPLTGSCLRLWCRHVDNLHQVTHLATRIEQSPDQREAWVLEVAASK